MNDAIKITLLKRKFQSLEYIEDFIRNYQDFVTTGLQAFETYRTFRQNVPGFLPNDTLLMEENFWEHRVKPNFTRMLNSSKNVLIRIQNNESDCFDYLDGLAGDFRGLSRGFDGIEENFMDVATPQARENYRRLWDITDIQACNIEKAINDWWKDSSILKESITGPIDEQELLRYLQPGESVD